MLHSIGLFLVCVIITQMCVGDVFLTFTKEEGFLLGQVNSMDGLLALSKAGGGRLVGFDMSDVSLSQFLLNAGSMEEQICEATDATCLSSVTLKQVYGLVKSAKASQAFVDSSASVLLSNSNFFKLLKPGFASSLEVFAKEIEKENILVSLFGESLESADKTISEYVSLARSKRETTKIIGFIVLKQANAPHHPAEEEEEIAAEIERRRELQATRSPTAINGTRLSQFRITMVPEVVLGLASMIFFSLFLFCFLGCCLIEIKPPTQYFLKEDGDKNKHPKVLIKGKSFD